MGHKNHTNNKHDSKRSAKDGKEKKAVEDSEGEEEEEKEDEEEVEIESQSPPPSQTPDKSTENTKINAAGPDDAEYNEGPVVKDSCGVCPPGIDLKAFIPLLLILMGEGLVGSSLSSYVSYLVVDVGAVSNIDDAGDYAGYLLAIFFICQFFSSLVLGTLSDKYGRRVFILTSVFLNFCFQFAFGFSTELWMALLFRGCAGLSNGNVGIAKTSIAEMTNKNNRVKAFTFIGLMFGVGSIIGSTLGGFTARPAVEYSDTFSPDGFFGKYPYTLPCFIISAYILSSFVMAFFFVKETNAAVLARRDPDAARRREMSGYPTIDIDVVDMRSDEIQHFKSVPVVPETLIYDVPAPETPKPEIKEYKSTWEHFLGLKYPIIATVNYGIASAISYIYVVLINVWTVATIKSGGMGFSTLKLGIFSAINGLCVIIVVIFICSRIINRFTPMWSIRFAALFLIPVSCCAPLANNIIRSSSEVVGWIYLIMITFLWQIGAQVIMNGSVVLVANSVHVSKLGKWNGISQSVGSIARALSPVTISPLLAWSFKDERKFPFNYFFAFFLNAILCIILFVVAFLTPMSLNKTYVQREEERLNKNDDNKSVELEVK